MGRMDGVLTFKARCLRERTHLKTVFYRTPQKRMARPTASLKTPTLPTLQQKQIIWRRMSWASPTPQSSPRNLGGPGLTTPFWVKMRPSWTRNSSIDQRVSITINGYSFSFVGFFYPQTQAKAGKLEFQRDGPLVVLTPNFEKFESLCSTFWGSW